jgi:hypothetical protein
MQLGKLHVVQQYQILSGKTKPSRAKLHQYVTWRLQNMIRRRCAGRRHPGTVGRAVRAEPDGHTVSIGNRATHLVNGATFMLPYD